jgi:pimeloyl-ACP methyl ester carboxylesterase
MAVFVVAHGAWSSGWAWRKMRPLMRATGHDFFTPSYTGLGERQHLASPSVNLSLHIDDVVNVLEFEDLREVVLIGHSFGGLVATGVADRVRNRIARVIYLDAFVPENGQSLMDMLPEQARDAMRSAANVKGDGWRVPPREMPPDTPEPDRTWAMPRRAAHPIAAFEEPLQLSGAPLPPRAYIYCTRIDGDDRFGPFADRARRERWPYAEIDASHNPHITAPHDLCAALNLVLGP